MWYKELRRVQKDAKEKQTKGPLFYHITLILSNFDILKFDWYVAPLIQEVEAPGSVDGLLDMNSLSITDSAESLIKFTEKEQSTMRDLPKKECKG